MDDTGDETNDDDDIMFQSFSSCSPRYSQAYMKFEELKLVCSHLVYHPLKPLVIHPPPPLTISLHCISHSIDSFKTFTYT